MKLLQLSVLAAAAIASTATFALNCPTQLHQNAKGFWYSQQKPGWQSKITTPKKVRLSAKDFAGVVYSQKQDRLACVYKASNGSWVALVSNLFGAVQINKADKDDAGKASAWRFNQANSLYSCGQPNVKRLSKCNFEFKPKAKTQKKHVKANTKKSKHRS